VVSSCVDVFNIAVQLSKLSQYNIVLYEDTQGVLQIRLQVFREWLT
jgi:hypothetical protein